MSKTIPFGGRAESVPLRWKPLVISLAVLLAILVVSVGQIYLNARWGDAAVIEDTPAYLQPTPDAGSHVRRGQATERMGRKFIHPAPGFFE